MADETVKNNLRAVEYACTVDEKIKYLRDLIKGETKDNLALFADGAFERAVQIASLEKERESDSEEEMIDRTQSGQDKNDNDNDYELRD